MRLALLSAVLSSVQTAIAQTGLSPFVLTTAPSNVPTAKVPDAPLAGNGDIGLTFAGSPDHLKLYFGKNDFWRAYPVYPGGGIALPGGLDIMINELRGAQYEAQQVPGSAEIKAAFTKVDRKSTRLNSSHTDIS